MANMRKMNRRKAPNEPGRALLPRIGFSVHTTPAVHTGSQHNEVAGNSFMPNLAFRGFISSPVSGTPQGLAVHQNCVRINEAFGDTANWDLIPTAAIQSVTIVTNNSAFGLNALGGVYSHRYVGSTARAPSGCETGRLKAKR
jgi:hypothetical protein